MYKDIKQKKACILSPFVGKSKIYTHEELHSVYSNLASDRLQIGPLKKTLDKMNYNTSIISLNKNFQLSELNQLDNFDICFISKMRPHMYKDDANQFAQFHTCCVLSLKRKGSKIITLYSDHLAKLNCPSGELYKNLLHLSDHIITPSQTLNDLAQSIDNLPKSYSIIEDPSLLKRIPFKLIEPGKPIQIIWFGNPSNLIYLLHILKNLVLNSNPSYIYHLRILTSNRGINQLTKVLQQSKFPIHWKISFAEWDINNQPMQLQQELSNAHISLLPSDPQDPRKCGVSHNRLVDSLQSGCVTLASPIESYKELSKICLIGEDFSKMLDAAINDNKRLCIKYSELRSDYLKRFDPGLNASKWEDVIRNA